MLQHLWTGPISNAAVDVVQGSRSVEVRSVGVTKGAAIDRILGEIVHSESMVTPIDYVLCIGHFLGKDEDIYVFFDPEYPSESKVKPDGGSASLDRRPNGRQNGRSNSRNSQSRTQKAQAASERSCSSSHSTTSSNHDWREGSSVLDLKGENYFSCAVGRKRSNARYLLNSSEEVVSFLKELATATAGFQSSTADYMFLDRQ
uniref:Trehalose-6-phosphate synthase n=1 Tax=Arundo donax TaxID=35708 RepID=A0A0A9E3Z3_ARUDO